jgi:acetate kinase
MRLLVVNVGSSSVKLSVLDGEALVASTSLELRSGRIDEQRVEQAIAGHGPLEAVGHRIVHGGAEFTQPVLVDERVRRSLQSLVDLAPLHLPKSLAGLDLVSRLLPGVPAVACFDTAFHATIPAAASTYALPAEWRRRWPLRRFGFHGLSHAWASTRVAELTGEPISTLRTVTCHLGAGASLAAVAGGVSVDTTMGFTPLEGLVMATRSGSVDPGLVLWLEEHVGLPPAELASTLEHRSGMLGLAGSADMRQVLDAEAGGDEDAALGVSVYLHRLRAGIAAMAAAMGGVDCLAFTGGVGERAASVRSRAAAGLGFLGISLDDEANATARPDAELTGPGRAAARTFVIEAREDVQIARELGRLLAPRQPGG